MYKKIDQKTLQSMCVSPSSTVKQTMVAIGRSELGTAFIVNSEKQKFVGLITDGDIRRFLLDGYSMESKVELIDRPESITATLKMSVEEIVDLFSEKIRVIPILDTNSRIVEVAFSDKRFRLPVAEPNLGEVELAYVTECVKTGWVSSSGKFVKRFEKMFAEFCGSRYAIATTNGTTALHLALLALDIQSGDEVIVPSMTFIATANAVKYTGATPVFVDSEPATWNIDPARVEAAINPNTKAIVPVHLYGHPADMDPILEIAKKYKLAVIEDAAEAHGAKYKGQVVGSISDMGIFSFYGNKIITTGEGGMIVTNSKKYADQTRILRDHGMSASKRYWHPVLGYNYRLTNIQAALGVAQMERIESIIASRVSIGQQYEHQLKDCKGITLPPQEKWAKNVYWLYTVLVEKNYEISRETLVKQLDSKGIETRPLFPPVHTQPIYNTGQTLPVAESLYTKGISLPSFPRIESADINRITDIISGKN